MKRNDPRTIWWLKYMGLPAAVAVSISLMNQCGNQILGFVTTEAAANAHAAMIIEIDEDRQELEDEIDRVRLDMDTKLDNSMGRIETGINAVNGRIDRLLEHQNSKRRDHGK